jgi:AP-3 complex subunit beta
MLVSLLAGLAPMLNVEGDDEEQEKEDRGGVVLRREQVKRVLFEGKAGIIEHDVGLGMLYSHLMSLHLDPSACSRRGSPNVRILRSDHRQRHAR